jgi:hypothetical protein
MKVEKIKKLSIILCKYERKIIREKKDGTKEKIKSFTDIAGYMRMSVCRIPGFLLSLAR